MLGPIRARVVDPVHSMLTAGTGWHPHATKNVYGSAGSYIKGPRPKIVWHTTEGYSLPRYSGSAPHFTLNPKTGQLWQHIPVNLSALSLEHRAGTVDTNRANAVQVELIGFARETFGWSAADYQRIADLARWIEKARGVPRHSHVTFSNTATRLSPQAWLAYGGHCGHQHVPGNAHWDPGRFRIDLVLGKIPSPPKPKPADPCLFTGSAFGLGASGVRVKQVQKWINTIAVANPGHYNRLEVDGKYGGATFAGVRTFQRRHKLAADGVVGKDTWSALCRSASN
jgi:hypothetical protein